MHGHLCARSSFDVVVLVGSAGTVRAFRSVLSQLPFDFPSALILARHRFHPGAVSLLDLLESHTALPLSWTQAGERVRPASVYVVPPGFDLSMDEYRRFELRETRIPFAGIDHLLLSVARRFGRRALVVILSGGGMDGAQGARAIREAGGTVLVQNKVSSEIWGMGAAAVRNGSADFILPLEAIGKSLIALAAVRGTAAMLSRAGDDLSPEAATSALARHLSWRATKA